MDQKLPTATTQVLELLHAWAIVETDKQIQEVNSVMDKVVVTIAFVSGIQVAVQT